MATKNVRYEYDNPRNGGRERVYRKGEKFFINSDWGDGFSGELREVSRNDMEAVLRFTKAPSHVVADILG